MAGIRTDSIRGRGVKESRDRRDIKLHYWSWISDILKAPYRMRSIFLAFIGYNFKNIKKWTVQDSVVTYFLTCKVRFQIRYNLSSGGNLNTPFPFTLLNHFLSCLSQTVMVMSVCIWSLDLEIRFLDGAHPSARLPLLKRLLINWDFGPKWGLIFWSI